MLLLFILAWYFSKSKLGWNFFENWSCLLKRQNHEKWSKLSMWAECFNDYERKVVESVRGEG